MERVLELRLHRGAGVVGEVVRRVNLLRAHGSPTGYLYHNKHGCRCAACRGARACYNAAYLALHGEARAVHKAAYRAAHREAIAARSAVYKAAHREEITAQQRNRKYNLLPGEWDAIFSAQGNRCAICGATEPGGKGQWHTGHDHKTGIVRGILCHEHNVGLGYFRDDPEHLMAAIEYLAAVVP